MAQINKKKFFGPILFILIVVLANNIFGKTSLFWLLTLRWHLLNKEVVAFHNVKRELPLRWWVWDQNQEQIAFATVPLELRSDYPLWVFFSKSSMTEEELKNKYGEKTFTMEGKSWEFVSYKTAVIGGETVFGVRHINKDDQKIFERWTIPSKGLVISIPDLSEKWYPYVWDFIASEEWVFR